MGVLQCWAARSYESILKACGQRATLSRTIRRTDEELVEIQSLYASNGVELRSKFWRTSPRDALAQFSFSIVGSAPRTDCICIMAPEVVVLRPLCPTSPTSDNLEPASPHNHADVCTVGFPPYACVRPFRRSPFDCSWPPTRSVCCYSSLAVCCPAPSVFPPCDSHNKRCLCRDQITCCRSGCI